MRDKILIVDDSMFNRQLLRDILHDEYTIIEAENGRQALEMIGEHREELLAVLLDIVMPEVDGVKVLKILHEKNYTNEFPVLMVTGEQDMGVVGECFDYGISDFIRKPVNTDFVKQRVKKLIELYSQKNNLRERSEKQTIAMRSQHKMLQQQAAQLKKSNERIIDVLGTVVESRNMEEGVHVKLIKGFTKLLAVHMMEDYPEYELTEEKINIIASASVLHDIGKIMIPDAILLKPGKLTEEEFEYVKSHSIRGYDIIESLAYVWDEEYVKYSKEITRFHHEKYDGSGYPDGLKGEEIPISAQLVSVADCFASLISESVYKDAIPFEDAFNMILQGECGVFSFKILECFRKSKKQFEDFWARINDKEE